MSRLRTAALSSLLLVGTAEAAPSFHHGNTSMDLQAGIDEIYGLGSALRHRFQCVESEAGDGVLGACLAGEANASWRMDSFKGDSTAVQVGVSPELRVGPFIAYTTFATGSDFTANGPERISSTQIGFLGDTSVEGGAGLRLGAAAYLQGDERGGQLNLGWGF